MPSSPRWTYRLAVVAALLAAALLRAPTHAFPPGVYHDEAFYGLDGLATIADGPRLWYAANNGREPLFIWLVALSERALGPAAPSARLPIVFALRLPALAAGLVLVAAMFALGARLAGRRAGLIAAALTAALPWATLLARTGLRAGLLPPVLALAGAATLRAFDRRHGDGRAARRWAAFGGALAGLALYTYTAARALPIAVGVAGVLAAVRRGGIPARAKRAPASKAAAPRAPSTRAADAGGRPLLVPWLFAAAIVVLPLAVELAVTPGALFGRLAQVAVTGTASGGAAAPASTNPSALAAIAASAWRTAGMVFVHGDRIARHNIPFRPVFGPLAAALWTIGVVVLLAWLRPGRTAAPRRRAAALALAATAAFALPTALAADAPHFLRAVGLLPALVGTAAVGGAALVGWAEGRWGGAGRAAAWLFVAAAVALEGRDVLRYDAALADGRAADPWAARTVPVVPDGAFEVAVGGAVVGGPSDAVGGSGDAGGAAAADGAGAADLDPDSPAALWSRAYHAFEGGATTLARDVNAALSPEPFAPRNGGRVWLDRRLRDGWAAVPFLIPIDRVTLTDPYDPVLFGDGGVAYIVPYGLRLDEVWAKLPAKATIAFDQAVMERGDQAPRASPLYVRATGPAVGEMEQRIGASARTGTILGFNGGPFLTAAAIVPEAAPLVDAGHRRSVVAIQITTQWIRRFQFNPPLFPALAGDVTLFVHVLDADGRRIDHGDDAPLGQGVYPFGRWRDGDVIIDRRILWLPASTRGARVVAGVYAGDAAAPLQRLDGGGDGVTVEVGRVP